MKWLKGAKTSEARRLYEVVINFYLLNVQVMMCMYGLGGLLGLNLLMLILLLFFNSCPDPVLPKTEL